MKVEKCTDVQVVWGLNVINKLYDVLMQRLGSVNFAKVEDAAFKHYPDSEQDRAIFFRTVLQADIDRDIYHAPPVSPETFILSPYYLNQRGYVYPKVLEAYNNINSGKYNRVILTGGTGWGKSTAVNPSMLYQIYLLSMMRDCHSVFNLSPSSEILTIIQAMKAGVAKDQYKRVRALVEASPYFNEVFKFDKNLKGSIVFPNRLEIISVSGNTTDLIGKNIYQLHLNEANFMEVVKDSKKSTEGGEYDQAKALYQHAAGRRKTRFVVNGKICGMIYVDSSQNYPGQLTDVLEKEVEREIIRTGTSETYVCKYRVWDTKPKGTFRKWFHIFKGDDARKPKVVQEEDIKTYSQEDQKNYIDKVPLEWLDEFVGDPYEVLKSAVGHAVVASHPFIPNVNALSKCFKADQKSIFSEPKTDISAGTLRIIADAVVNPEIFRWCHIDLSRSGDSTGVAIGHVAEFVQISRGVEIEVLPHIVIDGTLEITPPPGGEIDYARIRELLYLLRDTHLMNIKWVSFDQYQSVDSQQILRRKGFTTGQHSMDRVPVKPYQIAKAALMDGRVSAPVHKKLFDELRGLEYDTKSGKVDHSPTGSKDIADAVGAVIYKLTTRRDIWRKHGIRPAQIPESIKQGIKKDERKY